MFKFYLIGLLLFLAAAAAAQETPPGEEAGPWTFEESIIVVVQVAKGFDIKVENNGQPVVKSYTFATRTLCEHARVVLNPSGLAIPLGSGGSVQALLGRAVSPCFHQ